MPSRMLRDWTDSLRFDDLSAEAERLFTRLIMKADDYGRFHADPRLVKAACFPLSESLRANTVSTWLTELSGRKLVFSYTAGTLDLLAIVNFRQRLKMSRPKFPAPDGKPPDWLPESIEPTELPGTSRNFPEVAEFSGSSRSRSRSESRSGKKFCDEPGTASPPLNPLAVEFPEFPTVGEARTWVLTDPHVAELETVFPGINARAECLKAHAWIKANLPKRKTPAGMRKFLNGWMGRAQNGSQRNVHPTTGEHEPPGEFGARIAAKRGTNV